MGRNGNDRGSKKIYICNPRIIAEADRCEIHMEKKYSASAWSLHVRERNCPQDR
jgi:hypothetical protein